MIAGSEFPLKRLFPTLLILSLSLVGLTACSSNKPLGSSCPGRVAKLCSLAWKCTSESEKKFESFTTTFGSSESECRESLEQEVCDSRCPAGENLVSTKVRSCFDQIGMDGCKDFYDSDGAAACRGLCITPDAEAAETEQEATEEAELSDLPVDGDPGEPATDASDQVQETISDTPDIGDYRPLDDRHIEQSGEELNTTEENEKTTETREQEIREETTFDIHCHDIACEPGQKCCMEAGSGHLLANKCQPAEDECTGQVSLLCDDSRDCSGALCCALVDTEKLRNRDGLFIQSSCKDGCRPPDGFPICGSTSDCSQGSRCCYPFAGAELGACINSALALFCDYKD
ncbi:MAG: hypothetical protein GXP49_06815 [Deltaproteobacteria bacterium]|nr:hypothetical protein [Deltaproteobacteria bacterium]